MTTNSQDVEATPEQVWDVLEDGWLYPVWVVGAARMREVDDHWPEVGARLHHSVGLWPLLVDDETRVVESEPGRRLRLRAQAWPGGEADIEITIEPRASGSTVRIFEATVSGPASHLPKAVEGVLMRWRNRETLRRLAHIAENRSDDQAGHNDVPAGP